MTHSDIDAWQLVCAALAVTRADPAPGNGSHYAFDGNKLETVAQGGSAILQWDNGWRLVSSHPPDQQTFLDLYLPLVSSCGAVPRVLGQLGQSIDGFIATSSGHSHYVTGEASIVHLHRLRALSDCVIVGASTVAADDPQLTTRLVSGANCVRVVLDPNLRLPMNRRIFSDEEALTLRVRKTGVPLPKTHRSSAIEDIELPTPEGKLDLSALLAELQSRGHRSFLVEGGGVTVSAFHAASLLDRLHIVIAPFIMGAGRPGLRVPGVANLQDCMRCSTRIYMLGNDVLFDCDLRNGAETQHDPQTIRRVFQGRR